jgi:hypothetical protein
MKKEDRKPLTPEADLATLNKFVLASGGPMAAAQRLGVTRRTLDRWRHHEIALAPLAKVAINALLQMGDNSDGVEG